MVFQVLKHLSTNNEKINENEVNEFEVLKNDKTFSIPTKIWNDLSQYEERHVLKEIKAVLKEIELNFANNVDI